MDCDQREYPFLFWLGFYSIWVVHEFSISTINWCMFLFVVLGIIIPAFSLVSFNPVSIFNIMMRHSFGNLPKPFQNPGKRTFVLVRHWKLVVYLIIRFLVTVFHWTNRHTKEHNRSDYVNAMGNDYGLFLYIQRDVIKIQAPIFLY